MTTDAANPGLPRLLRHVGAASMTLPEHLAAYGPPLLRGHAGRGPGPLVATVEQAGLHGRGGAAFPVAAKMRVAAERGRGFVIANGSESEPASRKDRLLLDRLPHLVIDGAQLAAEAVRARHIYLYVHPFAADSVAKAVADRQAAGVDPIAVEVVIAEDRFVAGESSAVVRAVTGGPALPAFTLVPSAVRGVDGRPTLVQNVETLAHLALISRYGAHWFRSVGTADDPGSALVTVFGDVRRPGVYEIAHGRTVGDLLADVSSVGAAGAVLLGGYHGTWLRGEHALPLPLAPTSLRAVGATFGAGVIAVLDAHRCPLVEAARVVRYLAGESAGQCGPCANGLPAISGAFDQLAAGWSGPGAVERLQRWSAMVVGRSACHHPDGTSRFVRSALGAFADEVAVHVRGGCTRDATDVVLPLPRPPAQGTAEMPTLTAARP